MKFAGFLLLRGFLEKIEKNTVFLEEEEEKREISEENHEEYCYKPRNPLDHRDFNKKNAIFPIKRPYSEVSKASEIKIHEKITDFPKFLGTAMIKGYTLRSFNLAYLKKGEEIYLKREKKVLIDEKKKKKNKPNSTK